MSRSRSFCFTINNPTKKDRKLAKTMYTSGIASYLILANEIGENKTPHIQGYVYLKNAKTIKTLSKKYLPRAHIEISKAKQASKAYEYCMKDGDFKEYGEQPSQGKINKEKLDNIMQNPYENFHLYNQYRKSYRDLQLREKSDHWRLLWAIPKHDRFDVASYFQSVKMDDDMDTYDGEENHFISLVFRPDWIENWINGYPTKIKRGYEIIPYDPYNVFIMYDPTEPREYKHLKKILPNCIRKWSIEKYEKTISGEEEEEKDALITHLTGDL